MSTMPYISVIIPVYNTAPYLRRCLDSVCGQTLTDLEIICVNDCSQDESLVILKEYAQHDTRIVIINLPYNSGNAGGSARNTGIISAKGKYLGFVDSDDTIDQNFYAALYSEAIKSGADITEAPISIVADRGVKTLHPQLRWFCSSIFRADFIKKNTISFPALFSNGEDLVFMARVLLANPSLQKVESVSYNYHQVSTSVAHHLTNKKCAALQSAFDLVFSEITQQASKQSIPPERAQNTFHFFFKTLLRSIAYQFADSAKRKASEMLVNLYANYPYFEEANTWLAKSDPVLLALLRQGDVDKLTDFFLSGKQRLAGQLRAHLKQGVSTL